MKVHVLTKLVNPTFYTKRDVLKPQHSDYSNYNIFKPNTIKFYIHIDLLGSWDFVYSQIQNI